MADKQETKDRIYNYWNINPPGPGFTGAEDGTREFFEEISRDRYRKMPELQGIIKAGGLKGKMVLEVGCGAGTDTQEIASTGADIIAVDLTDRSALLTSSRLKLFGLDGHVLRCDSEMLPFMNASFDVVYSHGVLHHTPDTERAISEIHRVLKTGAEARIALYNRNSLYYYYHILYRRGIEQSLFNVMSKERILSEYSESRIGCPLSKYYTIPEVEKLFSAFSNVEAKAGSMVYQEMPLSKDKRESLEDEEMKSFFEHAAHLYSLGREEETGRFIHISAVK